MRGWGAKGGQPWGGRRVKRELVFSHTRFISQNFPKPLEKEKSSTIHTFHLVPRLKMISPCACRRKGSSTHVKKYTPSFV